MAKTSTPGAFTLDTCCQFAEVGAVEENLLEPAGSYGGDGASDLITIEPIHMATQSASNRAPATQGSGHQLNERKAGTEYLGQCVVV